MLVNITNIKWEDDAPKELPASFELDLDDDFINEILEDAEGELTKQDIIESMIYEDLPTICAVDDLKYSVISFDFEIA
jgi:hypothetical protein